VVRHKALRDTKDDTKAGATGIQKLSVRERGRGKQASGVAFFEKCKTKFHKPNERILMFVPPEISFAETFYYFILA